MKALTEYKPFRSACCSFGLASSLSPCEIQQRKGQLVSYKLKQMKADEFQYSTSDLSRALLREFLSQKGLKKTLEAFEKEDLRNKKKINKNLLIEMLSMKNLFLLNRQSRDGKTSLLEILVTYLNKKYQVKKNHFATTQPNASFPKFNDQEVQKIEVPNKPKDRPSSSKPFKSYEFDSSKQNAAPAREKEELKVIYQKLSKKQEGKEFRIVESNTLKRGEPSKIEEKPSHLEEQRTSEPAKPQVVEVEDEYKDEFEEPEDKPAPEPKSNQDAKAEKAKTVQHPIVQIPRAQPQARKPNIQKQSPINNKIQEQKIASPLPQQQQHPKESKKIEAKPKDSIRQQKPVEKFVKSNSEQYINPTPILHAQSQFQLQRKQIKNTMGSSASVAKKEEEQKFEQPKEQPQQKARTEMRLIGKKKDASSKDLQITELKKELAEPTREEPKKQVQQAEEVKPILAKEDGSKKQIDSSKKVEAAPMMVALGKKRKPKEEASDTNYPTKFKFDENFTHEIPKELTYEYKEYGFQPITIADNAAELYPDIIINSPINYKQKGGGVPPIKKKIEKIITSKDAERLKKVVFQSSPSILPKSWAQGFILSPSEHTPYGLKQIEGGPCGIIAAAQCYFLKHLLLCSGQTNFNDDTLRQVCLVAAIANMLWKVKSTDKLFLAFPPKGASKVEISNLRTSVVEATDFPSAFAGVWAFREEYIGSSNHGVAALLYSIVLTKGTELIEGEMDIRENPLIGNHGHCTQQFVNLLLTGRASSNCFDGEKVLDDYRLKGIAGKAEFGFLTIFEALKYLEVGRNLKNPVFPAWVICKEFHYHVVFAPHYLVAECNAAPKFDIVYFDGLYNCNDRIRITLGPPGEQEERVKDLPLIEQVMMTKWGRRTANWNGSTRIL